ncbi:16S rRNA (guanine(966)-N(2))-methyltransferase RsmD [Paraglaciecola aestuariivivens]
MKRGVKRRSHQPVSNRSQKSGSVRIISGRFRGRKLPVLDVQGLRPTTDKNKEMLFNWLLPFTQDAICLDAFAGSGGLGFEALSRYAKHCTFIEFEPKAAVKLQDNIQLLSLTADQVSLQVGKAQVKLRQLTDAFDLIFLDPPFHQNMLPEIIDIIAQQQLLAEDGVIYIECEGQGANYAVPDNWQLIKEKQHSQILSRLYQRTR